MTAGPRTTALLRMRPRILMVERPWRVSNHEATPSSCGSPSPGLSLALGRGHSDIAQRMTSKFISIRGAREHNLKNISLDLPRERLVVITGLSGSGKSSLAFDTIYAAGHRPSHREPDREPDGGPRARAQRRHAALSPGADLARAERRVQKGSRRTA